MPVKKITEPAAEASEPTDPIAEAVKALLGALEIDERNVKGLEIRPNGAVRYVLNDNGAGSVPFAPMKRYCRDRDGRIIE